MVVVLVALAGGYGVFRALSPPSRQATSAFQQAPCPFALGAGLVEGHNVTCGFLVVVLATCAMSRTMRSPIESARIRGKF
jgi:hypothetical protein